MPSILSLIFRFPYDKNNLQMRTPEIMKTKESIKRKILPEISKLTLGLFWVSVASGIVIAFQYRPFGDVFKNVQEITYSYPYGSFIRGLHYWSAELFLIFMIIHVADHFIGRSYAKGKRSRWPYLTTSTALVFFCSSPVLS
ncbi:MAG TPA: DUF4405 domain-containing protein [Deltaproteobacteria bacterium]|nr:DUF4405 domain-containing protein [Deltaproteobacteria bacterium]